MLDPPEILYPPFYPPMEFFGRDLSARQMTRFFLIYLALSTSERVGIN